MPESIDSLFASALALPPSKRAAFLHRACEGDADLRSRVEELLLAHESARGFLEHPAVPDRTLPTELEDQSGAWIDRYKLLQKIGEGGCGTIYMAEQATPVRRRVALKIIKLGMDTREVIARFEAERQALALMDHPNIARVFDGGATPAGRPYFVMELVQGAPLTDFCDGRRLPVKARLELFIAVCSAVQHAHQKGVIHRDLKPTNVLVTEIDGRPVPKVIDFGIARAIEARLTEKTLFTHFQQFVGTPAYMSPEQAGLGSLDVDTRSDVYSLGVLLYELLTGRTPYDTRKLLEQGYEAILRTIRETEPPTPSTRLRTLSREELMRLGDVRSEDPRRLGPLLFGELDWIVMKALDKDRERRYETANGLAADLQRHLLNEPVSASPPGTTYRLAKFIRRHRLAVAAAAVIAVAVSAGSAISVWQALRASAAKKAALASQHTAEIAEQKARSEAARSAQVAQFMKEMLGAVGPAVARGRDTALLREILDTTSTRLERELQDQPAVKAELLGVIGQVYLSLGDSTQARTMLRQSLEIHRRVHGPVHAEVAAALTLLARSLPMGSDDAETETLLRAALAIQRQLHPGDHPAVAIALKNFAVAPLARGDDRSAEALLLEAIAIQRKTLPMDDPQLAYSMMNLGAVLTTRGDYAGAKPLFQEVLRIQRQRLGDDHPSVAISLMNLGAVEQGLGNLAVAEHSWREALALQRRLLGRDHPDLTMQLDHLGSLLSQSGRHAEAEPLLRELVSLRRRFRGATHSETASAITSLAAAVGQLGRLEEAEALFREALGIQRQGGDSDVSAAESLKGLAQIATRRGDFQSAEALLLDAWRLVQDDVSLARPIAGTLADLYAEWSGSDATKSESAREWRRKADSLPMRLPKEQLGSAVSDG